MEKSIEFYEKSLPTHKHEYLRDRKSFREKSLIFLYHYSCWKSADEDVGADVFLEAEKIMDRLIERYFAKDGDYYVQYLKSIAKRLILNRNKKTKLSQMDFENQQFVHILGNFQSIDAGIEPESREEEDRKRTEQIRAFLEYVFSKNPTTCYAFHLRYDIPMEGKILWGFRKHLQNQGISYKKWLEQHLERRWKFQQTRSRMIESIHRITFRILEAKDFAKASQFKEKKRLKAIRLHGFLNQGLYNSLELSRILGLKGKNILKSMNAYKQKGIRICRVTGNQKIAA